jgi:YHS domain-containing protein
MCSAYDRDFPAPADHHLPLSGKRQVHPGAVGYHGFLPFVPLKNYFPSAQQGKFLRSCRAIDPICKMTVDEKTAKFTSEYKGKRYYFCSPGCKQKFDADPAKYA